MGSREDHGQEQGEATFSGCSSDATACSSGGECGEGTTVVNGSNFRLSRLLLLTALAVTGATLLLVPNPSVARAMSLGRLAETGNDFATDRPVYPLRTTGGFIVDATGRRVLLASANWYGAESVDYVVGGLQASPIGNITRQIRQLGFNSVRLQWSNEMLEKNPVVPDYALAANPGLRGRHAMDVFDEVVHALTAQRLMVILDNHNSNAEWCCGNDGNELWYNSQYPETSWIGDWKAIVARYRENPFVVGADLRNEPRIAATWGGPPSTNWQAAAERGGDAVLSVNPNLLVIVEGVDYAGNLSQVQKLPVTLDLPDRLVYSAHDYGWFEHNFNGYSQWYDQIYPKWGYLVTGPDPQPLWVSEFGTCNTSASCVNSTSSRDNGFWFNILTSFLEQYKVGWAYWPLNGTQTTGAGRTWGAPESYGVLNTQWNGVASPELIQRLQQLEDVN